MFWYGAHTAHPLCKKLSRIPAAYPRAPSPTLSEANPTWLAVAQHAHSATLSHIFSTSFKRTPYVARGRLASTTRHLTANIVACEKSRVPYPEIDIYVKMYHRTMGTLVSNKSWLGLTRFGVHSFDTAELFPALWLAVHCRHGTGGKQGKGE